MSESSAKSANTHMSVFSVFGTNSDDAQAEVMAMMASGMSAEDALNVLLVQATAPGGSLAASQDPSGSYLAAGQGAITSGSQLGASVTTPPGLQRVPVQQVPCTVPMQQDDGMNQGVSQPGCQLGAASSTVSNIPTSSKMMASSSPRGRRVTSNPHSRKS